MTSHATLLRVVEVLFVLCLVYTVVLYAFVGLLLAAALREARRRRAETAAEDFAATADSRFTIPVSIVVPAWNEEVAIVPVVRLLLSQDYPLFEVIVVSDGSTDRTVPLLQDAFALEPSEEPPREALPHARVRAVYRSRTVPRLRVIDKDNGGKADALNCGVSYARYRYLCGVDGDTAYRPDALAKGMRAVMHDPARVVGVTSLFVVSRQPEVEASEDAEGRPMDPSWLSNFQYLDLVRSFLCYRLAWSRYGFMLCCAGAFSIFRRDVVFEVGGFSPAFSCEDIEITFRIHEKLLREKRPYRILSLPDLVASTEGPGRVRDLSKQRVRWQRVVVETVWAYRKMFANPRFGSVGLAGLPYYVFYEALAPVFQAVSLATLLLSIAVGILSLKEYLYFMGIIMFAGAISTTVGVHLAAPNLRGRPARDVARLLLFGPLDFFFYRPLLLWSGVRGLWGFLRGEKAWNKLVRNPRGA